MIPHQLGVFGAVVGGLLLVAGLAGAIAARTARSDRLRAAAADANGRILTWWWLAAAALGAAWLGFAAVVVLFALASFHALREFVSLHRTRRGDHRALFLAFFVVLPLQYVFLALPWPGMVALFIPVYAALLLPMRAAAAGDATRFLERAAKIQFGLLLCVYAVSHIPAIALLRADPAEGLALMCWFLAVMQLGEVGGWAGDRLLPRGALAPAMAPGRSWGGLLVNLAVAAAAGWLLAWLTPVPAWLAASAAAGAALLGAFGHLLLAALRRDAGVAAFGSALPGHGGLLDRIGGMACAAPAFVHLARWHLGSG
jgi:phosphatidate cytidylyltransferase